MGKTIKKIIIYSTILAAAFILFPQAASAQPIEGCLLERDVGVEECKTHIGFICNFELDPECGICCLMQIIYNIAEWVFVVMVAVAALLVIIGAFNIMTAAGSPDKITSGRNFILYAAIGLAVGLLARAIPPIVQMVVGA